MCIGNIKFTQINVRINFERSEDYTFGKVAKDLDFNSRLISCLDIYEALTEERPYRIGLSHGEAMDILNKMKTDGFIDSEITKDIDYVFDKVNGILQ